ncbi:MAG: hypothetical protein M1832_003060 [Thelocarpon impressellum]|nr:MAG: hypothetical protein M1832_003060 [Thelocarpon impressellum]
MAEWAETGVAVEVYIPATATDDTNRSVETASVKGGVGKSSRDMDMDGDAEGEGEGDEMDAQMQAMLGFGGFGTTKQKKVLGNDVYGIRKEKKTEYRQYMSVSAFAWAGPLLMLN